MREVKITTQGPLGWGDIEDTFKEDSLLLTASGEVKQVRHLREGDVLVRFAHPDLKELAQYWTIIEMEWLKRKLTGVC
jgi:hypothetical protein